MRLIDKDGKPRPSWRLIVIAVFTIIVSALTISGMVYAMSKQVSIVDGVNLIKFTTYANNTAEVLAEKGIVLSEADVIKPELYEVITDGAEIIITRAKNITIIDGDRSFDKQTAKKTVNEALEQFEIKLGQGVYLNVQLDDEVTDDMLIEITRKSEEMVEEDVPEPFKTIKKPTTKLKEGQTNVVNEGADGVLTKLYKVRYDNGEQVSKEFISKKIKVKPVDKIVEYGVKNMPETAAVTYHGGVKVSRGSEMRYKATIKVTASAYDLSYQSTGKRPGDRGYGVTATGMKAQKGVIAVDPRVIPLGSRLYIEAADGSWTYGNAVAGDTGSSIKGNKIDVFVDSRSEAMRFGRRTAIVYILE